MKTGGLQQKGRIRHHHIALVSRHESDRSSSMELNGTSTVLKFQAPGLRHSHQCSPEDQLLGANVMCYAMLKWYAEIKSTVTVLNHTSNKKLNSRKKTMWYSSYVLTSFLFSTVVFSVPKYGSVSWITVWGTNKCIWAAV